MIVLFATAWDASAGGINVFNMGLARGLAARFPGSVTCAVTSRPGASAGFDASGIRLITVSCDTDGRPTPACGDEVIDALEEAGIAQRVDWWIGHDLVTGPAAVEAARRHGGRPALVHHMDYESYQNLSRSRGDDTVANVNKQIALFSAKDAVLFGVGALLTAGVQNLGRKPATSLTPGFPSVGERPANDDRTLRVLAAGRFERKNEALKRIGVAVEAFGLAVKKGRRLVTALDRPTMTVLGVDDPVFQNELVTLACDAAGFAVSVNPAGFDPDPAAVARHISRANLVIVPSIREGFGLVGWEAIGARTPLILGKTTGLAHHLEQHFDDKVKGLLEIVDLDGSANDADRVADAILRVARDLPKALRNAGHLFGAVKAELGCTWEHVADDLYTALVADQHSPPATARRDETQASRAYVETNENHYPNCVELGLAAAQGATRQSLELIAELRFGATELEVDGVEAKIALSRAMVTVVPDEGRISGRNRLGDRQKPQTGLEARAGGVWILNCVEGPSLLNKVLGDDTLCLIEAPPGRSASAKVEVTAAKRDMICDVSIKGARVPKTKEKVMGVFLKKALLKSESGHVVLSVACLREPDDEA